MDHDLMDLSDLLAPEAILPALRVQSKKQAIQALSEKASALTHVPEREIFDTLLQRERLGSTGVGHGIAIPHGKLVGFDRIFGVFARLDQPVDFEALDGEPVDLIFVLLVPEGSGADHLKALARLSRALRDQQITAKLRETEAADALFAILSGSVDADAA